MAVPSDEHERTLAFAEIALQRIRALRLPASPRNCEIWYQYATGYNPNLNHTINDTLAQKGALDQSDVDRVYETYLSPTRATDKLDSVGARMTDEIARVLATINAAAGSATSYTASLADASEKLLGASDNLRGGSDGLALRAVIERLVAGAKEMETNNRNLEARLSASREEIEQLQQNLEVVRTESLTDPLTTLANRKFFDAELERAVAEAKAGCEPLALLLCRRSLQGLQRSFRAPHRRSGASPGGHFGQASRQKPRHRRALRRRGIRRRAAEDGGALGDRRRRPDPARGDEQGAVETVERRTSRPCHDFDRGCAAAINRHAAILDRARRQMPLRRQAQRPQPSCRRKRSGGARWCHAA